MKAKQLTEHLAQCTNVLNFSEPTTWPDEFNHAEPLAYELLYHQIIENAPSAGRAYYAVALWRQINWQIIYLQVASVYHLSCSVQIEGFRQGNFDGALHQMSLPLEISQHTAGLALTEATRQLSLFFKQCHLHINHICKLAKGLSERLSADLIAKALLQVSPLSNKNELNQALMHWQDALFIQQYSQYQFKQNNPQLQRATCQGKRV